MSAASDQKLLCELCSPFCCSFNEFVEEKVIAPSYSSAILTPPKIFFIVGNLSLYWICYNIASVLCFGFLALRHVGILAP